MPITSAVVADDEILNRELLAEILPRFGIAVRTAKDGVQALKALEAEPAGLLISDIRMPGMGGLKLLLKAREKWPDMPVVMMTAFASVESAVESMRQGAYDYLMKPFGVEQVEALLIRLNERNALVREVRSLRQEVRDRHQSRTMLGSSPAMNAALETVARAAKANATVLVHGESGTGKELVARALHEQSARAAGPSIAPPSPPPCSPASCSAMRRGPSPAPPSSTSGASSWPMAGPCCSTRSARSHPTSRPSCCACSKSGNSSASAARVRSMSMCASSPPPIAT